MRHENLNFSIHCRKRRSIALALNKLQKPDDPGVKIVYGDGGFASGKKSKSTCPSSGSNGKSREGKSRPKRMSLKLAWCVPTAIRSSTYTVAEYRNDRFYEVRSLKWCYDLRCRAMPLKHRNVVGAKMTNSSFQLIKLQLFKHYQ